MVVNRAIFVHFVEIIASEPFRKKFSVPVPGVIIFMKSKFAATKSFYEIMMKGDDCYTKSLKKKMFSRSSHQILKDIGSEHV